MSSADEYLHIETPENVAFGYEVAGIGSRFLAALIDSIMILIIESVTYVTLLLIVTSLLNINLADEDRVLSAWLVAMFGLVGFGLLWGYYIFFELVWNGQSPGKRALRLRVIKSDGRPIALTEAIIRNIVRLVDFLPFSYAIGVTSMFIDGQARRLGDMAAGTLVVIDRETVTLASLKQQASMSQISPPHMAAGGEAALQAGLPVERLTEQDVSMIEEYLRRAAQLANSEMLGRQIAGIVRERLDLPPQEMTLAVLQAFLLEVMQARQR